MEQEGYVKFDSPQQKELFERIRSLCLSLPGTSERLSHGAPTFFVGGKKSFLMYHNNHHGDGKIAIWCACPPGVASMRVEAWPDVYFIPAYVGHLGWVGMRLDRDAEWEEIAGVIGDAYTAKAAVKKKAAATRRTGGSGAER